MRAPGVNSTLRTSVCAVAPIRSHIHTSPVNRLDGALLASVNVREISMSRRLADSTGAVSGMK